MGVVRVDNLAELREKVMATQKQLESLYLDEHVSAGRFACMCGSAAANVCLWNVQYSCTEFMRLYDEGWELLQKLALKLIRLLGGSVLLTT
jgi:hypothetical protein